MRMFASDLDRTLIYSERALVDFNQIEMDHLISVEKKADRDIAFMTKESIADLRYIAEKLLFVPVTTRTMEQFKRIFILSQYIPLTYAVTSNGANIIYKGSPDKEWRSFVQERLRTECVPLEEMITQIENLKIHGSMKIAEGLFFYYLLEESINQDIRIMFQEIAKKSGYRVSLQGRKLYFMPNPICKSAAVKFIKEREGITFVYGAGDSLLDHDFLKACDLPFVPSHGELAGEPLEDIHYTFTKERGVTAGEEILSDIKFELS